MSDLLNNIAEAVLDGDKTGVRKLVQEAVDEGIAADIILADGLLAGMNEVGALFKDGEMFVPEVLVSAKALQGGIDIIRPALAEKGITTSGKILTVTVEGDLHDIGIKLVGLMLEGAGFEVVNIGIDKTADEIIEKFKEVKPNILGMSAMLTTTMGHMKVVAERMAAEVPNDAIIMIGGAPTSPAFAEKLGVFYAADANDAVEVAKKILSI
ncbi:cobalamin-dependent protein [Synergistaceae bacterium OttesenSCG-928-D05]|nr:cobalamin-dependent protein [Synergistaceae bacterium OttesenSCG-928-D05]